VRKLPYDAIKDFSPIAMVGGTPNVLVVPPSLPVKTLAEFIAAAKQQPGKFNYASAGLGSYPHLDMLKLLRTSGTDMTHVPYKGGAEWMQALLGVHVHFLADAAQWAPHVDSGQCRILAMATEQRIPKYPDAPTLKDRGINAIAHSPYGLVGTKDLPAVITQTLHEAFTEATNDPGLQSLLDRYIQVPWRKNPAEYRAYAEQYFNSVKPLLIKAGLAKP
jgi:tripartite-type tricarboxylate transporter receptor subunit TctC